MKNSLTCSLALTTGSRRYIEPSTARNSSFFHRKIKHLMIDDIML